MTREEFKKIRNRLRMYYPRANVMADKETFDLWYERIGKADFDKARKAVDRYVIYDEKKEYAPTVGVLYDYIKGAYEKEKFFKRQIDEFFERAVSCYPNYVSEDAEECRQAFKGCVSKGDDDVAKIVIAANIHRLAIDTGKAIDNGEREYISFLDLVNGIDDE